MALKLDLNKIYKILDNRLFIKSKNELINMLNFTRNNFIKYTNNIDNSYGQDKYINPLLWQMGHVIFFYSNHVLDNLPNCKKLNNSTNFNIISLRNKFSYKNYIDFYDSFITPLQNRNGSILIDFNCLIGLYQNIYDYLIEYLTLIKIDDNLSNSESYIIALGILHNEMHNEAFLFSKLSLYNTIQFITCYYEDDEIIEDIEFIHYSSGTFKQGIDDSIDYLIFDNEMPSFDKTINAFSISKYPITEYQFLQFVISGGYEREDLWCYNSLKWIRENNITMPLYWVKTNNKYYKLINSSYHSLTTNLPMANISYYEAVAYCNWKGYRLPTESEFEYVATNGGNSLFPWGNTKPDNEKCNINYKNFIVSVNKFNKGNNCRGVCQLIGNIWEWCQEPIYPYDGFKIDPVYREMSYPFFGFKRICKGGCFAVPDFLIHPKYRNAQQDDCRIQFIGFRVIL